MESSPEITNDLEDNLLVKYYFFCSLYSSLIEVQWKAISSCGKQGDQAIDTKCR